MELMAEDNRFGQALANGHNPISIENRSLKHRLRAALEYPGLGMAAPIRESGLAQGDSELGTPGDAKRTQEVIENKGNLRFYGGRGDRSGRCRLRRDPRT